jgi:hypothetical protein
MREAQARSCRLVRVEAFAPRSPAPEGVVIKFTVPVKTVNEQNFDRGNSRLAAIIRTKRRQTQRAAACACAQGALGRVWRVDPGTTITLRRFSVGKLDSDGLHTALKSVRDGVADALGVDDGSSTITWKYEQAKGKRGVYAVEVEIVPNQEQTREALT